MATPKKIEVDEAEYAANLGVVQAVDGMLKHPEARSLVLKARKIADPKAVIPEVDAAAPVMAALAEQQKKFDELQASIQKDKDERAAEAAKAKLNEGWAAGRAYARECGYMDEGLKKLEEFMQTEGLISHRIAIPAFEALHPAPPPPVTPGIGGTFEFFSPEEGDKDDMKRLLESRGEDAQAVNSLINKALAESRGQSRRI